MFSSNNKFIIKLGLNMKKLILLAVAMVIV